jgi:hypothetical protein
VFRSVRVFRVLLRPAEQLRIFKVE